MERVSYSFYSVWMIVTWGQGKYQSNFLSVSTPPHPTLTSNQTHHKVIYGTKQLANEHCAKPVKSSQLYKS
jgi:hypothetical protein